jgi:hypothetical protein
MLAQSAGSPPIKAPAGQMRGALAPVTEPAETAAETVAQAPATATAENMTPEEITAAADKAKEEEGGRDIAGAIERARGLLEPDFKPAPLQPIKFNYWRPPPRGKA